MSNDVWSANNLVDLIRKRHEGDGWLVFTELANASGYKASRWADAMALGTWSSTKYEAHFYETKISREDVKKELRDPSKSSAVGKFCHYWWLVISDPKIIADLVIPEEFGILAPVKRGSGTLLGVVRRSPKRKSTPFNEQFSIACIRNMAKSYPSPRAHADLQRRLEESLANSDENLLRDQLQAQQDENRKLRDLVAVIEKELGVPIDGNEWRGRDLGRAIQFAIDHPDANSSQSVRLTLQHLSRCASDLEDLAATIAQRAHDLRQDFHPVPHAPHCAIHSAPSSLLRPHCRCGAVPVSEAELKLSSHERSEQEVPATGDDDARGRVDRGHPGSSF